MTKRTSKRLLDNTLDTRKQEKSLKGSRPIARLPLSLEITEEKREGLLTSPESKSKEANLPYNLTQEGKKMEKGNMVWGCHWKDEVERTLKSPCTRNLVKDTLRLALQKDCVDAYNDIMYVAHILEKRMEEAIG